MFSLNIFCIWSEDNFWTLPNPQKYYRFILLNVYWTCSDDCGSVVSIFDTWKLRGVSSLDLNNLHYISFHETQIYESSCSYMCEIYWCFFVSQLAKASVPIECCFHFVKIIYFPNKYVSLFKAFVQVNLFITENIIIILHLLFCVHRNIIVYKDSTI